MRHEWIRPVRTSATVSSNTRQVLQNMEMFSRTSQLLTVCMGALARQLDHNSLQEIQQTFSELDQDGDGAITFPEMRAGFERVFGTEALDFESLEEIFNSLDLDGSGKIDYTEFCAAGADGNTASHTAPTIHSSLFNHRTSVPYHWRITGASLAHH